MLKRNRKWFALFALLVVASLVLAACGQGGGSQPGNQGQQQQGGDGQQAEGPDPDGYILMYESQEPPSLDPGRAEDTVSFEIIGNTYEGLVRRDANGNYEKGSGIAEDWTVSEDGTVYTFKLRQDAKWSDGKPVTAHDFEYAWKRAADPRTGGPYAFIVADYIKGGAAVLAACGDDESCKGDDQKIEQAKAAMGVKAVNDYTLEVTLEKPTPWFISLLSFGTYMPVRKDIVEKFGDKFATEAANAVYNGPFVVAEWEHESRVKLEKNPNYWDADTVKLSYVEYKILKDSQTMVNLYETGQLDVTAVPQTQVEQFQQQHPDEMVSFYDGATFYINFNTKKKPWNNAKARRAVNLAIDRETYINSIRKPGGGEPAVGFTNPVLSVPGDPSKSFYNEHVKPLNLYPAAGDKAQAKQLWEEALKEEGISGPVKAELLCYDTDTALMDCQYFQEQIKEALGLEVTIKQVPFDQKLDLARRGEFELNYAGWGPDYNHVLTFLDLWVTNGSHNDGKYSSKQYDDLVKQLQDEAKKAQQDPQKQIQIAVELEKLIAQDAPIAPIFHRQAREAQKPYVKGILRQALGPEHDWKWAYTQGRGKSQ